MIASAVNMIPKSAEVGVPTVADLQATFDKTYFVGRQVSITGSIVFVYFSPIQ